MSEQQVRSSAVEGRRMALPHVTVHGLIEAQCDITPDAVAVQDGPDTLTYRELDQHANYLAHKLHEAGLRAEDNALLHLPRRPSLVVAVLAVLKAGGAYVPLGPDTPAKRRAWTAADSNARAVITTTAVRADVAGMAQTVIVLDTDDLPGVSTVRPGWNSNPDTAAYMIYTSGSTGKPKGVIVEHRSIVNYLLWAKDAYELAPGCRAPLHASLAFDLMVTSLFGPLIAGGSVTLAPSGGPSDLAGLAEVLVKHRDYSFIKLTPAHAELLEFLLDPDHVPGIARRLVIGGEQLVGEALAVWRDRAPDTRIVNEYGPTEATVGCCVFETPAGDVPAGPIPIGVPIANTSLYSVDPEDPARLTPPGRAGELFIGGAGVARGYHRRPALTAERFVPDPFGGLGARLYRTGDLVRRRDDGNLEFLGRMDDQIKVNGYRMELGEIAATLRSHPAVATAAVVAPHHPLRGRVLVAYAVRRPGGPEAGPSEVLAFLASRLPRYMVPASLIWIDALPLARHGKVDVRRLEEMAG